MSFEFKADKIETLNLLKDLVSINSVNPMIENSGKYKSSEKEISEYLKNYLEKLGLKVTMQEVFKDRKNVIAFLPGKESKETLLLETHMDTVPLSNKETSRISPVIKNGRVYARGACDAKGSLTSMLIALKLIVKSKIRQNTNVYFVVVVDEEFTSFGVNKLIKSKFKSTSGVVGEPTNLKIITAHKGRLWFKIHTFGESAHGSSPNKDKNAIYMMNEIISMLKNRIEPYFVNRKHKLLGSPTINIGKIYGGEAPNIVPNKCSIEIDCRLTPNERSEDIIKKIFCEIRKIKEKIPYLKVKVERPFMNTSPLNLNLNENIVNSMIKASEKILGEFNISSENYDTDAGRLTDYGIPCVVFGPGDIAYAHSKDEFIEIQQVVKAAEVYANLITKSGGGNYG